MPGGALSAGRIEIADSDPEIIWTPEVFERRMGHIERAYRHDPEAKQRLGEHLMMMKLIQIGYEEGVFIFERILAEKTE